MLPLLTLDKEVSTNGVASCCTIGLCKSKLWSLGDSWTSIEGEEYHPNDGKVECREKDEDEREEAGADEDEEDEVKGSQSPSQTHWARVVVMLELAMVDDDEDGDGDEEEDVEVKVADVNKDELGVGELLLLLLLLFERSNALPVEGEELEVNEFVASDWWSLLVVTALLDALVTVAEVLGGR